MLCAKNNLKLGRPKTHKKWKKNSRNQQLQYPWINSLDRNLFDSKKKQTHELNEKEDLSNVLNFCDEKKSVECNNALFYAFLMW